MVLLFAAAVCQISSMLLGNSQTQFSLLPKGDCLKCCPIEDEKDVRFLLYTRDNPLTAEQLFVSRPPSRSTYLRAVRPTVIYLHGFTEVAPGQSGADLRDAYLAIGDYNVILMDWGPLIALPWYLQAVRNTKYAARVLTRTIRWLVASGISASSLHVVGFSLGAEAAGLSGKALAKRGIHIGRITGLDPAFPIYNLMGRQGRLSSGDAMFVDVIHTNAGIFGYPNPIGDADFYPNPESPIQPGCLPRDLAKRRLLDKLVGCSHRRAWQYYVESIRNPQGFPAWRCSRPPCYGDTVAYMGIAATPNDRGMFYLSTNPREPYARNL